MKKYLMILLALVLVAGLLAIPALAEGEPTLTAYTVSCAGNAPTADEVSAKAIFDAENDTWYYSDIPANRYVLVGVSDGWKFDLDYLDGDQSIDYDGSSANFAPVVWYTDAEYTNPLLGESLVVISLENINGKYPGGNIHFQPRVIKTDDPDTDAYPDINIKVQYSLWFNGKGWEHNYDHGCIGMRPGDRWVIQLFKDDAFSDVLDINSLSLVFNNNGQPGEPVPDTVATLKPITNGVNGNEEEEREGWFELVTDHCFGGFIQWTNSADENDIRLLPVNCQLPEVGFYTSTTVEEASYIRNSRGEDRYDHRDDSKSIYLILNSYDADATLQLNGKTEDGWIRWTEETPGKVWRIDLDGGRFTDYARIDIRYQINYSDGRRQNEWDQLRILNATPGLRFCWPDWNENGMQPRLDLNSASQTDGLIPGDGRSVQLAKLSYNAQGEPVFQALTREELDSLTFSDADALSFEVRSNGGNLYIEYKAEDFAEDDVVVMTLQDVGSVFVYTVLPEFGFYTANEATEENYIRTNSGEVWVFDGTEDTNTIYFLPRQDVSATFTDLEDWRDYNYPHMDIGWDIHDYYIAITLGDTYGNVRDDFNFRAQIVKNGRHDSRDGWIRIYDQSRSLAIRDISDDRTDCNWGQWDTDLEFCLDVEDLGEDKSLRTFEFIYQPLDDNNFRSLEIADIMIEDPSVITFGREGDAENGFHWIDVMPLKLGETDIIYQDENGSELGRIHVSVHTPPVLEVGEANAMPGKTFTVDLKTKYDFDYTGMKLVVCYDKDVMTFESAQNVGFKEVANDEAAALEQATGDDQFIYSKSSGRLIWLPAAVDENQQAQSYKTIKAGTTLATLTFKVKDLAELKEVPQKDWNGDPVLDENNDPIPLYSDPYNGFWTNIWLEVFRDEHSSGENNAYVDYGNGPEGLPLDIRGGGVRIMDHTPGDVDGSGEPTMWDVSLMLKWHVGEDMSGVEGFNESALDTDGDGQKSLWDVTWLLRWLSNWPDIDLH